MSTLIISADGDKGIDGTNGKKYVENYVSSGNGRDGENASDGANGKDGGIISLNLQTNSSNFSNFSGGENEICVIGTKIIDYSFQTPINQKIYMNDQTVIELVSRGGRGGDGANGFNGEKGRDGERGHSATKHSNGTNGKNGFNGGSAGCGTNGMNGGKGGIVDITISEKDTHLLMLLKHNINGGLGGKRGYHGKQGEGGRGGAGGLSYDWTEHYDQFDPINKRVVSHTRHHSNKSGSRGRDGDDGSKPDIQLHDGINGLAGDLCIRVIPISEPLLDLNSNLNPNSNLCIYKSIYDVHIKDFKIRNKSKSNIFEPGDVIYIDGIVTVNKGGMPTPRFQKIYINLKKQNNAHVNNITLSNELPFLSPSILPHIDHIVNGTIICKINDYDGEINSKRITMTDNIILQSSLINRRFVSTLSKQIVITYPIEITNVKFLESICPGETAKLIIDLKNISDRPLDISRNIQVGLRFTDKSIILYDESVNQLQKNNDTYIIDVDYIQEETIRQVCVLVHIDKNGYNLTDYKMVTVNIDLFISKNTNIETDGNGNSELTKLFRRKNNYNSITSGSMSIIGTIDTIDAIDAIDAINITDNSTNENILIQTKTKQFQISHPYIEIKHNITNETLNKILLITGSKTQQDDIDAWTRIYKILNIDTYVLNIDSVGIDMARLFDLKICGIVVLNNSDNIYTLINRRDFYINCLAKLKGHKIKLFVDNISNDNGMKFIGQILLSNVPQIYEDNQQHTTIFKTKTELHESISNTNIINNVYKFHPNDVYYVFNPKNDDVYTKATELQQSFANNYPTKRFITVYDPKIEKANGFCLYELKNITTLQILNDSSTPYIMTSSVTMKNSVNGEGQKYARALMTIDFDSKIDLLHGLTNNNNNNNNKEKSDVKTNISNNIIDAICESITFDIVSEQYKMIKSNNDKIKLNPSYEYIRNHTKKLYSLLDKLQMSIKNNEYNTAQFMHDIVQNVYNINKNQNDLESIFSFQSIVKKVYQNTSDIINKFNIELSTNNVNKYKNVTIIKFIAEYLERTHIVSDYNNIEGTYKLEDLTGVYIMEDLARINKNNQENLTKINKAHEEMNNKKKELIVIIPSAPIDDEYVEKSQIDFDQNNKNNKNNKNNNNNLYPELPPEYSEY
ncbi:MAG: hypothetical protein Terrestrivirus6_31 [Terrestrivirus sp.]|uniref:DUF7932 domain-containing protein n=1 Tax=Terrestrivirus sp. TaxID=2487775 RepID=A0A3G4ZNF8_9VIRU|nr:MAG: hypothetical protein Terrestrivirus6_31 [Terrestrivirus sp.]